MKKRVSAIGSKRKLRQLIYRRERKKGNKNIMKLAAYLQSQK
jgi:hypothetical protein